MKNEEKVLINLIMICLISFIGVNSWSYTEFIGYGYTSCATCHYNGNGGGPVNDYGRALWYSEISSRQFLKHKTPEELAESAKLLDSETLDRWIRPGIKVRQLNYQKNPGGALSSSKNVLMQADASLVFFVDAEQMLTFVGTLGYLPSSTKSYNNSNYISRLHYLKLQLNEKNWLYAGSMDKVFGLKIPDHTAYSRLKTEVAQNDQVHALNWQFIDERFENSFQVFMGNLFQAADIRKSGLANKFEILFDRFSWGISTVFSRNEYVETSQIAAHTRLGLQEGSSLIFESGLINNKTSSQTSSAGGYVFLRGLQKIFRGYHLLSTIEFSKDQYKSDFNDDLRFSFGGLIFFFPGAELRSELVNTKSFSQKNYIDDNWVFQNQLYFSF